MALHTHSGQRLAYVAFHAGDISLQNKAEKLAAKLGLEATPLKDTPPAKIFFLYTDKGLELQYQSTLKGTLRVDFEAAPLLYRKQFGGGIKQPLARAVGIKANTRPAILDVTAGLGIDSYLLAGFGCKVCMIERSPFLAALLADGLDRIQATNPTLLVGHAVELLSSTEYTADTVYMDPMYPHRTKSALNKQEMRIIRELVGDDDDADALFTKALGHARKRVVVKRPKGAPYLCKQKPSHHINMKNSRFDVYMV